MTNKSNYNSIEKKPKKNWFKRIFFAVFGKARWFVIGIVAYIILTFAIFGSDKSGVRSYNYGLEGFSENYTINNYRYASVNQNGVAALAFPKGSDMPIDIIDLKSNKEIFHGFPYAIIGKGSFIPHVYAIGDDNTIYMACTMFDNDKQEFVTDEYIVACTPDFKTSELLCHIQIDPKDQVRSSPINLMHYYNGELTFVRRDKENVLLYSIDTKTGSVRISHPYTADENGTYPAMVMLLDDAFLIGLSDGSVYLTKFDEPLGEYVYRFDAALDSLSEEDFFNRAAYANGKLYVCRTDTDGKVYQLENKKLTEVLDVCQIEGIKEEGGIISLDTYKDGDKDILVITHKSGLITFDGEKATRRDVTVYLKDNFWILLDGILGLSLYLCIIGIIINLIIRKKTLMYKQILLTLPILLIPAIIVAINLYLSVQEQNTRRTEIEIEQVCRIATAAFEDYDFSDLDELDADAGVASAKLHEKLAGFNTENGDYIYSIIARTDDTKATVLARSDTLIMPYYDLQDFYKGKEVADSAGNVEYFLFEDVSALLSKESKSSSVYAYGWIHDSGDTGRYYLKVETDSWSFFTVRRDTFLTILFYIVGIAVVLTLITILTSIYVSKAIKRVTKTVGKIADGDFSARTNYKSKDELGEICQSVNVMAGNLENVFDEKDKTEKFYYKFVPEKFRELLGKEEFTDLALGDAKSLDLTVLFFDIRGFSINSEMMTAKENFEFVNIIYGKTGPIIRKYNGFVDKYIGDAVMALFENAEDAVKCGIEIYHEIVLNSETAKEIGVGDINIGIGIHSGMARIGIVGESERLSGTVISDTVNLSSRLESLTKQFKTAMLVSKDTVDRMNDPDALKLRYLGEVQVAGVNEVKAIYEVLDCLDEEEKSKREHNYTEFKEAVRLFHMGRRDEAVNTLKKISDSGNSDYVTELYYDYISNMSDEDKGNVFRFVRK